MAPKKVNSKKRQAEEALANASKKAKASASQQGAAVQNEDDNPLLLKSLDTGVSHARAPRDGDDFRLQGLIGRRFSFIPASARASEKHGGLLLEERLLLEIQRRPAPMRVPQSIITECIITYGAKYDPILSFKLEGPEATVSVPDVLLTNLQIAISQDNNERDAKPLIRWFKYAKELPPRVLCGVVKEVYTSWWMSFKDQTSIYLAIMSCIARLSCMEAVRVPFAAFFKVFDDALASTCTVQGKEGPKIYTWVTNNLPRLSLLMDRSDLDQAVAARGKWSTISGAVVRMYNSSSTGKKAFGFAAQAVQAEELKTMIDKGLNVAAAANFAFATVQAEQQKIAAQELATRPQKGKLGKVSSRVIQVDIVVMKISMDIKMPTEEWEERLSAKIKTASLGIKNGIPLLPHEQLLVSVDDSLECPVPKDVLQSHIAARELCLDMLEDANIQNFEDVKRVMAKAEEPCCDAEASFKQEVSYVVHGTCGADIDKSIYDNVLKLLPSKESGKGFVEVTSALDNFMESNSFRYCTKTAQAAIRAVALEVKNVEAGISPNMRLNSANGFWKSLFLSLPNFLTWKKKVGRDALELLFGEVKDAAGSKPAEKTKLLNHYKWMMTPEQRQELTRWCQDTIANAGVASHSGGNTASSFSSSSDGTRNIMRYF